MLRVGILIAALMAASASAEPITLKGLGPGLTKEQMDAVHPGLAKHCHIISQKQACFYGGAPARESGLPNIEALNTFAGVPIKMWDFDMRDGHLSSIFIILPTSRFDAVVSAMKERLGPPTKSEVSTVQNRMGATFDQTEVVWALSHEGSILAVTKRGYKVDEMRVHLTSKASLDEFDNIRKQEQKAGAKDM